jgi:plasmid stabilization system protein ParE
MNLFIEKSPLFQRDVTRQFEWYYKKAGKDLAWEFFTAVDLTLSKLARQPDLGSIRHFSNPLLQGLRSFQTEPPFRRLLIFYRQNPEYLIAERLVHGSRDLPRRLLESPGA